MAFGSQHSFWMVPESTYGTTPATPAFVSIPLTKFSGGASLTTIEDPTIRGDRQIAYVVNGAISDKFSASEVLRYGAYDSLLEAVCCGTWATNVLKAGTTYRSFTGERKFADLSDKPYFRHTGVEVSKMSLKCTKDALIETTFEFNAQDENDAATAITGATYGSIPTSVGPFDSFTGLISVGGTTQTVVQDFTLDIDNSLEEKRVVGSRLALEPAKLFSRVSGTLQVYFDNVTLFDLYKPGSFTTFALTLTDPAGNSLLFSVPKALITGEAHRDVSGPGTVSMSLKYMAILDPSTSTNISITRTPHA
jgi:hypothetical protein